MTVLRIEIDHHAAEKSVGIMLAGCSGIPSKGKKALDTVCTDPYDPRTFASYTSLLKLRPECHRWYHVSSVNTFGIAISRPHSAIRHHAPKHRAASDGITAGECLLVVVVSIDCIHPKEASRDLIWQPVYIPQCFSQTLLTRDTQQAGDVQEC